MTRRWTIGLLVLCGLWAAVFFGPQNEGLRAHVAELAAAERQGVRQATEERGSPALRKPVGRTAPQKAYDLLAQLQQREGIPLPGYVGGRPFQNRERRLPRGRYREYDVNRKIPGRARDAERIVVEQQTGKAYYTGDHYRTFIPLN